MKPRMTLAAPLLALGLGIGLTGCGPGSPEEARAAQVASCERKFSAMAPTPDKGNALCSCMVDELAKQDLEVTDMLGSGKEAVMSVTRSCAVRVGVPVQG